MLVPALLPPLRHHNLLHRSTMGTLDHRSMGQFTRGHTGGISLIKEVESVVHQRKPLPEKSIVLAIGFYYTFNHLCFLCSEAPPLSTPLCKGHKTRRFAQASSMKTLRHHLSSKPEKFRFIQRLGEYISNLMISKAVFEFHFFVNDL